MKKFIKKNIKKTLPLLAFLVVTTYIEYKLRNNIYYRKAAYVNK